MLHHLVAVGLALSAMTPFTSAEEQETTQQTSDRAQEDNATESGATRRIGGPDQVDNTIADDDASISRVFERRLYEAIFRVEEATQGEDRTRIRYRLLHSLPCGQRQPGGRRGSGWKRNGALLRLLGPRRTRIRQYRGVHLEDRA